MATETPTPRDAAEATKPSPPAVLYAFVMPDGTLHRSSTAADGPYILASDNEGQGLRLEFSRQDIGAELARYVYAGTWQDWHNTGRLASRPQPAAGAGLDFEPDEKHTASDMANVGYALIKTIAANRPDWSPMDCPSEIVVDLINELHDASQAQPAAAGVPEGFIAAARSLAFVARTSGGTAGQDADLCAALDAIEPMLAAQPQPEAKADQSAPSSFIKVRDGIHGVVAVTKVFPGDVIAEEYLVTEPAGIVGEVVEIGNDETGQTRIMIHTTREAIKVHAGNLLFKPVTVTERAPANAQEDASNG